MSEATHTPGPWEVDGTGDIIRTATGVNERGGMTGGIFVAQFFGNWPPTPADALLMAASPTMFEALQEIIDINRYRAAVELGDAEAAEDWACVAVARAALAKASPSTKGSE